MAKTGYLVIIYQDINPSSPTFNQTREERIQDDTNCPYTAEPHWIEDTSYCELTENGMLTGYLITVYRDVEELSPTYNLTREERELNTTECEVDSSEPNWQNIGEPFCRQKVYLPGGLMGNDGYMVQQQQDMNEYSETADEIREIETLDLMNCPLPNTLPDWEVIYEACHIIKQDGQLMFDGTKDVVRIDRNQYSPSWNNNVPETVNIEDLIKCSPEIDVQYRWVVVSGEYMCVGYDKYSVEKKQRSTDGETWVDVIPFQTRAGSLIEANSEDCGYEPTIEYRWVVVDEQYICVGFDKHSMEKKQQSVDGGEWTDVSPLETRAGELIEANSEDCGYEPTFEYRWVVITGQYECVDYDKYAVEKKQQSSDGGQNWTDVEPLQTRTGSLIERNSTDCGYLEPQYRWVVISGTFVCVGYDKHQQEKQQISYDNGTTWEDVVPSNTRTGSLIEHNSDDCGYIPETVYRWITISDEYMCVGFDKYTLEKKQQSVDGGSTWTDVVPTETRAGELIEADSEYCGYEPTIEYRWIVITGQYECVDYDKYAVEKKQQSVDGGTTWTDVVPSETRTGELIEADSEDCGYQPTIEYRWVVVEGQYECVGYDKYAVEKKQQSTDGGTTWTDVVPSETRTGSVIEYNSTDCGYIPPTPSYETQYLTFEALDDGRFTFDGLNSNSLSYSLDNGTTWVALASGTASPTVTSGNKILWKGNCTTSSSYYYNGIGTFSSTGRFNVEGNVMSLLYGDNFIGQTSLQTNRLASLFKRCNKLVSAENLILPATTLVRNCYESMFNVCTSLTTAPVLPATTLAEECYKDMFNDCTSLTTAPVLPATTLADGCYSYMFYDCTSLTTAPALPSMTLAGACYAYMFLGCTSLTTAPVLPATTLARSCYGDMFWNCTSLTTAPVLPATTLAYHCYTDMFYGCTSLTTAPVLPATTLEEGCYSYMFWNCTSLTTAPALPSTTLAQSCYAHMFYGCTSLTTAPVLPATTLASGCYNSMFYGCTSLTTAPVLSAMTLTATCYAYMFYGCTSLTTAPVLPATTLARGCYGEMFQGCTSLTTAPELPATTLADSCYRSMFNGCTSLTTAPELPATTLTNYCYYQMFYRCTNLNYIKCLATNIVGGYCTSSWLYNVASSGTFVKNAEMTGWSTGTSGIPSGWTVENQ